MKACRSSDLSFWWWSAFPKSSGVDPGHTSKNLKFGMAMCEILTHLLPTAEADQRNKSEGPGSEGNNMSKIGFSRDAIASSRSGWHQRLLRGDRLRVVVEGLCKDYGRTVSVECAFVTETGAY